MEKHEYAYFSGLFMGWVDAMKDPKEVARVMKDMMDLAKEFSKKGGLKVEE